MPKIFTVLDKAKPVFDITDKILMTICKLLLIADILIGALRGAGHPHQRAYPHDGV